MVARRRRPADAQGRRARGAGDRDARGAGRRHLARSFSLIETGEELQRGDEPSPTRSSVLVRLSHSHIRIGTLPAAAPISRTTRAARARCSTTAIAHLLSRAGRGATTRRGRELPRATVARARRARPARAGSPRASSTACSTPTTSTSPARASTTARGGSCPPTIPSFTAAYFDETGLYAFGRQPDALAWNLTRLAECLLPLGEHDELEAALNRFWPAFQRRSGRAILDRLGLEPRGDEADCDLVTAICSRFLYESQAPYEQFFFDWRGGG